MISVGWALPTYSATGGVKGRQGRDAYAKLCNREKLHSDLVFNNSA